MAFKRFAVSINARNEHQDWRDYLPHAYIDYLQVLGIWPVLIPTALAYPDAYLTALGIEGLILTGGSDVDPARYGQPDTGSIRIVPGRDQIEFALLRWMAERNLPVIGICRGMQVLNVFFGGGLVQDIRTRLQSPIPHDTPDGLHRVQIVDQRIAAVLNTSELVTNSHHHQGTTNDLLADDLTVFAISEPDGVIEGVLHREKPVIGVQWHPERPTPSRELDLKLFRHFLAHGAFWLA
jgi:putative glutamine amidotransferase